MAAAENHPGACVFCGAPLTPGTGAMRGRTLCTACGCATTDPWPTGAELDEAYARYRPEAGRFSGLGDRILARTRSRLARRVAEASPPGPVLDVGSGDGTLLDALGALGRDATGLERGSERSDVRAEEITEVGGEWAAIVFWHSLEHLPAPGASLDRAAELLEPGGFVFVAVPNAESMQAKRFGDRWFHLDIPRHLVHIPASALVARLENLGLTVSRVSHWRGGQGLFGWLYGWVGALPGSPNLYSAIRRPEARIEPISAGQRVLALGVATLLFPVAAVASVVEIAARRGGTVYVEAHRD